jgi:beta-xylosidase
MMDIEWSAIHNPIIDREPLCSVRDPALFSHDGTFYLFHSSIWRKNHQYIAYLHLSFSSDLVHWSEPQCIVNSEAGFSSPGNILRVDNKWVLCVQTYPIPKFQDWGNKDCRIWLIESQDLLHWDPPHIIKTEGSTAKWTKESRTIDPYLVYFDNQYWCFYKSSGQLGLWKSLDLFNWEEASPDCPIFTAKEIPDHPQIENVCVIEQEDGFLMFFSPCYRKRGIGLAHSNDLLHWSFDHYLNFPKFNWAFHGPTAPSVIDCRKEVGKWLMAFHGELKWPHHARLALAWSIDLDSWEMN